jgi:large subunit ribosomal protein L25
MHEAIRADKRAASTKSELKRLRDQGKIPGVVYGKQLKSPALIAVDEKELLNLLRGHARSVLELDIQGEGKRHVMINEVQRDMIKQNVLHVDFRQVNMDEEVRTTVPIEIEGQAAGVKQGGIMQVLLHELEVRCLPKDLPASIPIDVSAVDIGENLLVGDLKLPDTIQVLSDANEVIVTILAPQKESEAEEADAPKPAEAEEQSV